MNTDPFKKIQVATLKMSFLMEHQNILPDLKEIATELYQVPESIIINKDSPEYLQGAQDALLSLVNWLEQKGQKK
jgi:hypothetical protein